MNKTEIFENNLYKWDSNFIRKQKDNEFYKHYSLEIIDEKLFQTRIFFPSNIIPGIYEVNILQVDNKNIINESKKNIIAVICELAHKAEYRYEGKIKIDAARIIKIFFLVEGNFILRLR